MKTNKTRRYTGGGLRPDRRKKRQAEALGRQDAYNELSTEQKLRALPPEPGAKKQRAKLLAKLEAERNPKPKQVKKEVVSDATANAQDPQ